MNAVDNKVVNDPAQAALDKRHRLFSRIALFATGIGAFHTIEDFLFGSDIAPFIDLFITLFMFGCYVLSRKKHHQTARILGISFLNLIFTIYACLVPQQVGVYLFFFPLIAISSAVFDTGERLLRNIFVLLSVSLLIALFVSDFDLIGTYAIESSHESTFFLINLISSAFVLVVCINFVIQVNEDSENKLRALAYEIQIKNANLEKTNAELDRFLYSTTHDLRAPLLSIKGLVNIASLEVNDRDKIAGYLMMMTDRADKLDNFIKDIIDYSRNKRTDVRLEWLDLNLIVDEVMDNFKFMDGAQKIHFEKSIEVVDKIHADKSRISIVLNNLMSNAIKYHNYHQSDPWIKIHIAIHHNNINLTISDNGQGISDDHQSKIFNMFYRGTEKSKGSGLGLYIVKEMVEKMNGRITVESRKDEGTSFFITIPVSE